MKINFSAISRAPSRVAAYFGVKFSPTTRSDPAPKMEDEIHRVDQNVSTSAIPPPLKVASNIVWAVARPGIPAPTPQLFRNIEVVPAAESYRRGTMIDGGPVWPNFYDNPVIRHYRHDGPVDRNGFPSGGDLIRVKRPAVWGGRLIPHFGHLAAEHMNRIAASLYARPNDLVLFTTPKGLRKQKVPGYFWSIAEWLGLPREQIRLIKSPLLVEELRVTPQAECLLSCSTPNWYLDLLDELACVNRLTPVENDVVFVCRSGYLAMGKGGAAGEGSLTAALARAGVVVLDPARENLRRQMELYAGAKLLIFAEGSAIHGRQLLGRVAQKILILSRRPQFELGRAMLEPRCESIDYASPIRDFAPPISSSGGRMRPNGISFYDLSMLFSTFAANGIDLAEHWDAQTYKETVEQDASAWYRRVQGNASIDQEKSRAVISPVFDRAGLTHLL